MKKLLLTFLLFAPVLFLQAHYLEGPAASQVVHGAEAVRYSDHTHQVQYIRFGENGPASLEALLAKRKPWMPEFSGEVTFVQRSVYDDGLGMVHRRMQLLMNGIPVEGAVLVVHEHQGRMVAVNGDVYGVMAKSTVPAWSEAQALQAALAYVGAERYQWEMGGMLRRFEDDRLGFLPHGQLVFAPYHGDYRSQNFRLAWKFDLYAAKPLSRQWLFVDASTGEVIHTLDRIHTVDVVGSAVTRYSGTLPLTADQTAPNSYRLREAGRGMGIWTLNLQEGTDYFTAVDFTDANNVWNNVNSQQDECAPDAHIGAEATYDYFHLNYGWDSYDDNNALLRSYVHYDVQFGNAFWDGISMTYGDGDGFTFTSPLTTLDVCGHEMTHGVTEYAAGLIYANEPGALNESFSDIFGKAVEHYVKPTATSWLIGPECTNGVGIRSMSDPTIFQNPGCYNGQYWVPGADVHYNSGVQNHWFYILTAGDTGVNDLSNAYSVAGLGYTKAEAIAFRNLSVYLTPNSQYADARFYAIQAASDLYGACSNEMIQTANAWYAVGVGGPFTNQPMASFAAHPHNFCMAPATVNFTNTSNSGASYLWHFGDGGTSTLANPSHTYANLGTYSVKLVVTGCTGIKDSITLNNYVVLDTNLACTVTMPSTGFTTLNYCMGNILDPGGLNDYPDNASSVVSIQPPGADYIVLTFHSFQLEDFYDYLSIYDGPNTSSPVIGNYTGSVLPNGGTITSTGGSITLEFTSDISVTMPGFDVDFECFTVTAAPVAGLTGTPLNTCSGTVNFTDLSTNHPHTWTWNFGDGSPSSPLQHPSHTYTTPGTYSVTLVACNSIGCDTFVCSNCVVYDPNAPACAIASLPVTGTTNLSTCAGVLTDDGGSGNYSDNVDAVAIIAPPGASQVTLTFTQFDLETNWDFLDVHDGPTVFSPLIGSYTGNVLPNNGMPIVSSGGALTLHMTSDFIINAPGFEASWSSLGATNGPNADFTAPTTAAVAQVVTFTDQSTNATGWDWDFDDGSTSAQQHPTHSFATAGVYHVTLRVRNAQGCDDIHTQNIYVGMVNMGPVQTLQLDLWPNPARDQVHLRLQLPDASTLQLSVLDAWGQQVYAADITATDHLERVLDMHKYARGMYFVKIESFQGTLVRKMVLE